MPTGVDGAPDWEGAYRRQKLLIGAITSLLDKYGSSLELESLRSALLLTLMGHYVTGESCLYAPSTDPNQYEVVLSYGRTRNDELPTLKSDGQIVARCRNFSQPFRLDGTNGDQSVDDVPAALTNAFRVAAPITIGNHTIGLIFLGRRVNGAPYDAFDLHVLGALCAASATTFHNAVLYRNARLSAREIHRLYQVRRGVIDRVTHEFRTPLTAIRGIVELMGKGIRRPDLDEILDKAIDRLQDLIDSLLQFSDEDGCRGDSDELCDVPRAVQRTLTKHAFSAGRRHQRFVFRRSGAPVLPIPRLGATPLHTIVDALLENAMRFSPEGETIEVSIETCTGGPGPDDGVPLNDWTSDTLDEIEMMRSFFGSTGVTAADGLPARTLNSHPNEGPLLVVRITDHGIGIPVADIPHVSEPFLQASNSPETGVKGRGLGLALAQKIIARAGGSLCCRSKEGYGTTMSVFLPAT